MQLNKNQKTATIVYAVAILIILLFFTPVFKDVDDKLTPGFGSIFSTKREIVYFDKLWLYIGSLTFFYLLSLFFFNTRKRSE